jgi:hypothetical protein
MDLSVVDPELGLAGTKNQNIETAEIHPSAGLGEAGDRAANELRSKARFGGEPAYGAQAHGQPEYTDLLHDAYCNSAGGRDQFSELSVGKWRQAGGER